MSIKRTKSTTDSFRINQPDGSSKEVRKTGKVFQSFLSDLVGESAENLETSRVLSKNHATLTEIANRFNLDSEAENREAIKQSAEHIVRTRFNEKIADSKTGKKAQAVVSEYLANDKILSEKILRVLKNLKSN